MALGGIIAGLEKRKEDAEKSSALEKLTPHHPPQVLQVGNLENGKTEYTLRASDIYASGMAAKFPTITEKSSEKIDAFMHIYESTGKLMRELGIVEGDEIDVLFALDQLKRLENPDATYDAPSRDPVSERIFKIATKIRTGQKEYQQQQRLIQKPNPYKNLETRLRIDQAAMELVDETYNLVALERVTAQKETYDRDLRKNGPTRKDGTVIGTYVDNPILTAKTVEDIKNREYNPEKDPNWRTLVYAARTAQFMKMALLDEALTNGVSLVTEGREREVDVTPQVLASLEEHIDLAIIEGLRESIIKRTALREVGSTRPVTAKPAVMYELLAFKDVPYHEGANAVIDEAQAERIEQVRKTRKPVGDLSMVPLTDEQKIRAFAEEVQAFSQAGKNQVEPLPVISMPVINPAEYN